ncbi:MAG: bifunctional adenosylcobinamide kinase/adenosylcobinamide-phosphate guanylyltransferase [Methylococcales bacterium]|jgi:adenosylcobinamide kinase / adenosylcobinamide-phosphate guanylyltransferase|nr:bifunctional adenosylcobinamide kinase/adenosylcobinamide-phosphate guanylyltransferase [Methylococcales bacterium]MBT7445360.1 bifunctional adenosylcobinamide kinase/adenosylcobinamide-phosphate guanylyltransferase [Methylococcales bacterium]
MQHLILGGVKSGKSQYAETLAAATGKPVTYIATATCGDAEMAARITQHQQQRPAHWQLIEEPIELSRVLDTLKQHTECILIDCLTLWITNLLIQEEPQLKQHVADLLSCLQQHPADIFFVSNETNMGITPMDSLSRRYCDEIGLLHQQLGAHCDAVSLMVAGIATPIKGPRHD